MPKNNPTRQGGRPRVKLDPDVLKALTPPTYTPVQASAIAAPPVRTQLDDVLTKAIADLTREGLPGDAVCDYLGISYSAFAAWVRKGKGYVEGGEEPKEFQVYGTFYQLYRRAWSEYRYNLSKELHTKFVGKDWIRLMTILERRDRRNYGKRELPASNLNAIDPQERFL